MICLEPKSSRCNRKAYTLVELVMAIMVVGLMMVSLYAGFTYGFGAVKLARKTLRATQIMVQKTEDFRLYNWTQLPTWGFLPPSFTDFFFPAGTNTGHPGAVYTGFIAVNNAPTSLPSDYR